MKTRLLSKKQIKGMLTMKEVVDICDKTFAGQGEGTVHCPTKVHTDFLDLARNNEVYGGTNSMPAYIGWQDVAGCKFIGGSTARHQKGLPYLYACQFLLEPRDGEFLAVMDAEYITQLRTGAQTGVALRHMIGEGKKVRMGLYGCGSQGYTQVEAVAAVAEITELRLYDIFKPAAEKLAAAMKGFVSGKTIVCDDPKDASDADVIVLVTVAETPIVKNEWVKPGTILFPLGSYQELEEDLVMNADKIIVDHVGQTLGRGCLKLVSAKGKITEKDLYATIGQLACGKKAVGDISKERVVCVAIGTGMLDIAVGYAFYQKAVEKNIGGFFDFINEE